MKRTSALLAPLALAACGLQPQTIEPRAAQAQIDWNSAQRVEIAMSEYLFNPDEITLRAGQPYVLVFTNRGERFHNFTAPGLLANAELSPSPSVSLQDLADSTIDVPEGESRELRIIPTQAGSYDFECSVTLHSLFGMDGQITVIR